MALTAQQLDEVQAVAHNAFDKIMPDQFLTSSAFGSMMSKKPNLEYVSGGSKIQQPVQIAENQADGFIDGKFDVLDLSASQQLSFAEFDFKYQNYNNDDCNCYDWGALLAVPSPMVMMSFTCLKD